MKSAIKTAWIEKLMMPVLCTGLAMGAGSVLAATQQQGKDPSQQGMSSQASQPGGGGVAQRLPEVYKMTGWIGKQVKNEQGDTLGKVKDMVMDDAARIRYAIIERSEAQEGRNMVAVPINHFRYPRDEQSGLVLNVSQQQIQQAPGGFAGGDYPNMGNPQWDAVVITYWIPEQERQQAQARMQEQQQRAGAYGMDPDRTYLPQQKEQLFSRLDQNSNSVIERQEAQANEQVADQFADLDTYRNDRITRSEFAAFELQEEQTQQMER